jgi:hypothetical protein
MWWTLAPMNRAAVLKRLREEEERVATGWVGRKGQEDAVGALRTLLAQQRGSGCARVTVTVRQEDPYLRAFFMTLCRRYGLEPYRQARQRRTSWTLDAPEPFLQDVLWPLYNACTDIIQGEISAWYYALMDDFRDTAKAAEDEFVDQS